MCSFLIGNILRATSDFYFVTSSYFLVRIPVTLVTRSTLEVVIPEPAVPKLITKSKNKLAQISEVSLLLQQVSEDVFYLFLSVKFFHLTSTNWVQLSGANVTLVEDRPDVKEKIIKISGTPEQAERAQSLLQGFILSSKSFCIFAFVHVPAYLGVHKNEHSCKTQMKNWIIVLQFSSRRWTLG